MAIIRHMRRSAFSAGRPGGLIREIAGKVTGGLIGRKAKNFSHFGDVLRLIYSRFVQFMGVSCNGI